MPATFETRLPELNFHRLFQETARLYSRAEHRLFVDHYILGIPLKRCKQDYLLRFGLTARQFNAVAFNLKGKVEAAREGQANRIGNLRSAIGALEKAIKQLEKKLKKSQGNGERQKVRFILHQKRRRLHALKLRLRAVRADREAGKVRLCFGGKKLFRTQFNLGKNGKHEEWLKDWHFTRASQFLCLGSKDESFGNQTCALLPNSQLRLRVPPALEKEWGRWVILSGIKFRYGQEVIDAALARGEAVTYRFSRREKKDQEIWRLQATVERSEVKVGTDRRLGAIGVDLNPSHLDIGEIDRFGNPVGTHSIPLEPQGCRQSQAKATLAEAVAELVERAQRAGKPIVIEKLDFRRKKAGLREESPRYARMLSAFAYRQFYALLHVRAAKNGVEVIEVNPAYTSVIGEVKFASGYGLANHAAAAVVIARRGLNFGERLRSRSAFPLPARNRGKHVWSDWRRLSQRQRAEKVRGRRPSEGSRGRGIPLSLAAPTQAPAGQGPPWDGLASVPGRDSPAQMVGKAVRPAS